MDHLKVPLGSSRYHAEYSSPCMLENWPLHEGRVVAQYAHSAARFFMFPQILPNDEALSNPLWQEFPGGFWKLHCASFTTTFLAPPTFESMTNMHA